MLVKGLAGSIDSNGSEAVSAAEAMAEDISGVFDHLAGDVSSALPSHFDFDADATVSAAMAGSAPPLAASGSLVTVQQMIVRSEDDIRKVSQDLYNLLQTGSRAQGRYSMA